MRTQRTDQRGIALIMVMLLTIAVSALVAGAILLTGSSAKIARGQEREEEMRNAADAGIELGRSALNGGLITMPDSLYLAFQTNQSVYDANGVVIPGVTRSIFYGPTGSSTGQYGVFGSVISVITDRSGAVVVRRGELAQESFAKFAYYSDSENNGGICFGAGDNIFGPMHTNDNMCILSSGAHFHSTVEVSGVITGKAYGVFDQGYSEHGAIIPMPSIAQLSKLSTYATAGGMNYTATTPAAGTKDQARMRIEFLALDLDGDAKVTAPNEGFYKVYDDTGVASVEYVMGTRPATAADSRNCGHFHLAGTVFFTASQHKYQALNTLYPAAPHTGATPGGGGATGTTSATEALTSTATGAYRCWLGGDEHLFVTSLAGGPIPRNTFVPADSFGAWRRYTLTPDPAIIAGLKNTASGTVDTSLAARTLLAQYLWPLSRTFNPNSKGVIYVNGKVAVSGVLNSRLTLASNDNVIIADDLRYAIAPGSVPCTAANILGLLSPDTISMSDNTLNAPWDVGGAKTYDDSGDETVQGVLLTLNSFYVENYNTGSNVAQPCQTTAWGRGCLYLTGGIIQDVRGAVGLSSGQGYLKRYSYDICAFQTPPPYFPTTGRYDRNRYYEIDPVGFNVATFFATLAPTI
jgi:hypothetical protein